MCGVVIGSGRLGKRYERKIATAATAVAISVRLFVARLRQVIDSHLMVLCPQ